MAKGVFIGTCNLDTILYLQCPAGEELRINQKTGTFDYERRVGGPSTNAAITFATLGGDSTIITCIGNSTDGIAMKKELESYGIKVIDLLEGDVLPSMSTIVVNEQTGDRTIITGRQSITMDKVKIPEDLIEQVRDADFFYTDGNIQPASLAILQTIKTKMNKPVVVDAGSWKPNIEKMFSLADVVIASEHCKPKDGRELLDVLKEYGVEVRAITRGGESITWQEGNNSGEIKPEKVEAIDTLGAGDVFHGAYCYFKYVEGIGVEEALRMATNVAGDKVQYRGIVGPIEDYIRRMGKQVRLSNGGTTFDENGGGMDCI